jgi:hypothetical protein
MSTDLPDWYLNPPEDEGTIFGIGSAKMGNESRTQKAAEHRARTSIAYQLEAMVKAMSDDYTMEGGTDDDPAALSYFAEVSRQLTNQALIQAKVAKRWKRSDGTLYVLTEYSTDQAKRTAAQVASNPTSSLAEVKANMMIEKMNAELEKKMTPTRVETTVVGE